MMSDKLASQHYLFNLADACEAAAADVGGTPMHMLVVLLGASAAALRQVDVEADKPEAEDLSEDAAPPDEQPKRKKPGRKPKPKVHLRAPAGTHTYCDVAVAELPAHEVTGDGAQATCKECRAVLRQVPLPAAAGAEES